MRSPEVSRLEVIKGELSETEWEVLAVVASRAEKGQNTTSYDMFENPLIGDQTAKPQTFGHALTRLAEYGLVQQVDKGLSKHSTREFEITDMGNALLESEVNS